MTLASDIRQIRSLCGGSSCRPSASLEIALGELGLDWQMDDGELRLTRSRELLDEAGIRSAVSPAALALIDRLDVRWTVGSTNTLLMEAARNGSIHGAVLTAEQQVAGRGRRGRHWVSPFGENIYVSVGWRFGRAELSGLSLLVGMRLADALREAGDDDVSVKWPNDLLKNGSKVGGILIEIAQFGDGMADVVIGAGINRGMGAAAAKTIDQPFSTLDTAGRNRLLGGMLSHLLPALVQFDRDGFAGVRADWARYDAWHGREVRVIGPGGTQTGIHRGVDGSGQLLLEAGGRLTAFNAGEVSLREAT